jgi:hypothetical protein
MRTYERFIVVLRHTQICHKSTGVQHSEFFTQLTETFRSIKRRMHCCVSTATMVTLKRHNVTLY